MLLPMNEVQPSEEELFLLQVQKERTFSTLPFCQHLHASLIQAL